MVIIAINNNGILHILILIMVIGWFEAQQAQKWMSVDTVKKPSSFAWKGRPRKRGRAIELNVKKDVPEVFILMVVATLSTSRTSNCWSARSAGGVQHDVDIQSLPLQCLCAEQPHQGWFCCPRECAQVANCHLHQQVQWSSTRLGNCQ